MTREVLWRCLCSRHPCFETTGANLTAPGLRKLFDLVWREAERETHEAARTEAEGAALFAQLFGTGFRR